MLRSVTLCGTNDDSCLPPQLFEYQYNAPTPGFNEAPVQQPFPKSWGLYAQLWDASSGSAGEAITLGDLMDINGDGHLDVVEAYCPASSTLECKPPAVKWRIWPGAGASGFSSSPISWPGAEHYLRRSPWDPNDSGSEQDVSWDVVDMNGDGLPDLFTGRSLYLNTGSEFEKKPWSWPNGNTQDWVRDYRRVGGTGTFVVADLVDGNGGGCPDRFDIDATAGVWRYWRNRLCDPVPHAGYETPRTWDWGPVVPPTYLGRDVSFTGPVGDGSLFYSTDGFMELNGDGLLDFLYQGRLYLGTGRGFRPETGTTYASDLVEILTAFKEITSPFLKKYWSNELDLPTRRQLYGFLDLNGDGRRDFVRLESSAHWKVWLNTGNGLKSEPLEWPMPMVLQNDAFPGLQKSIMQGTNPVRRVYGSQRLFDLDASGATDLVNYPLLGGFTHFNFFANKGPEPELLVEVTNGVGGSIHLSYTARVGSGLEVQVGGETFEGGNLHFPVHVLSKMEADDGYGNVYASRYRYWDAYYDSEERSFRGFGRVEVTSSDNLGAAPNYSLHVFANGDPSRLIQPPHTSQSWPDHPSLARRGFAIRTGPDRGTIEKEAWTKWEAVPQTLDGVLAAELRFKDELTRDPESGQFKWNQAKYSYDDPTGT